MSKSNYKVMIVSNSKLGFAGKEIKVRKGYARFLYKTNRVLPICRKSNLQLRFLEKAQVLISKLNKIQSLYIYRESSASLVKKPIILSQVLKEIINQHPDIEDLSMFGFKFDNILEFGTYKLDIMHMSKKVCTIDIIVHNDKK